MYAQIITEFTGSYLNFKLRSFHSYHYGNKYLRIILCHFQNYFLSNFDNKYHRLFLSHWRPEWGCSTRHLQGHLQHDLPEVRPLLHILLKEAVWTSRYSHHGGAPPHQHPEQESWEHCNPIVFCNCMQLIRINCFSMVHRRNYDVLDAIQPYYTENNFTLYIKIWQKYFLNSMKNCMVIIYSLVIWLKKYFSAMLKCLDS